MDTIILRFRDSNQDIDTILEHNKIVEKKGYVWWGWWKKREEPNNRIAIKELEEKLKNADNVLIGLFDRTTSRFYKTSLVGISSNFRSRLNSPEILKTPKYYRDANLNCWFKITLIIPIDEQVFISLFTDIPIRNETLYVLPLEIRTTSNVRIEIKSNYILHLSDIHFGDDFGFPDAPSPDNTPLLERIKDYFTYQNKIKIGLIIVSGDITSCGDANIFFDTATSFFTELCDFFEIEKEQIILVPGNHDIPLKKATFLDYRHERTFKAFLRDFYNYDKEIGGLDQFVTDKGIKIDILRINSVRLRKVTEKNFGYVGWNDYKRIIENSPDPDPDSINIAVLHHHLLPVLNEEYIDKDGEFSSVSVTIDSGKVIEGLQEYNYSIVLHGHQHVPGINKVARGVKNETKINISSGIHLLGAGSAGVKVERLTKHMLYNSFSILKLENDTITVEAVEYNSSKTPDVYYTSHFQLEN